MKPRVTAAGPLDPNTFAAVLQQEQVTTAELMVNGESFCNRSSGRCSACCQLPRDRPRRGTKADQNDPSRGCRGASLDVPLTRRSIKRAEDAHLSRGSSLTPADAAACSRSAIRLHGCTDRGCKLITRDRSCKRTCTDHPWARRGAQPLSRHLMITRVHKRSSTAQPDPSAIFVQDHSEAQAADLSKQSIATQRTGCRAPRGRVEAATARVLMLRGLHGT